MALYAFDGTGDAWDGKSEITPTQKTRHGKYFLSKKIVRGRYLTNIVLFYKYYSDSETKYYHRGVGTALNLINYLFGGIFGFGARGRAKSAFKKLQRSYASGDEDIDIVAYSRGAAIARLFAERIFKDYGKIKTKNGVVLKAPPKIRFMGLLDTVASFGNPFNDNEIFFSEAIYDNVAFAVHGMAIDVKKRGFGLDRARGKNVLEVWFRGSHSDIGGNSVLETDEGEVPNRLRTNITLNFLLKKAQAVGVPLNEIPAFEMDFTAPIGEDDSFFDKEVEESRAIHNDDVIHYSVFQCGVSPLLDACNVALPDPELAVIEEEHNEAELSEQRIVQLTPELIERYPNTQKIYEKLYS